MAQQLPPPLPDTRDAQGAAAPAGAVPARSTGGPSLASIRVEGAHDPPVAPFHWRDLRGPSVETSPAVEELAVETEIEVTIELGRAEMTPVEILKVRKGGVIALDRLIADPVDVVADGRLVARGEVLVLDGNFCVRVTELVCDEFLQDSTN
jgi:flagellar motor switch protein FliN/FliY